jgi:hypothetical protein
MGVRRRLKLRFRVNAKRTITPESPENYEVAAGVISRGNGEGRPTRGRRDAPGALHPRFRLEVIAIGLSL